MVDDIYLVLDESGNLHKNSTDRYFIIGGFLTDNSLKGRKIFNKAMANYKKKKNITTTEEIKGSTISKSSKEEILLEIASKYKKNSLFEHVFIVVDKSNLEKQITDVNVLYNYFIKILISKLLSDNKIKNKNVILKIDNKTIKVGSLNTLEDYLKSEFFFKDCEIKKVIYIDSHTQSEIQLADLICNYYWRKFEKNKAKKRQKYCSKFTVTYFPANNFGK